MCRMILSLQCQFANNETALTQVVLIINFINHFLNALTTNELNDLVRDFIVSKKSLKITDFLVTGKTFTWSWNQNNIFAAEKTSFPDYVFSLWKTAEMQTEGR